MKIFVGLLSILSVTADQLQTSSSAPSKRVDGFQTTYQVLEHGNPLIARLTDRRSDIYADITAFYQSSSGEYIKYFTTGKHMHSDMQPGKRIKLHEGHTDLLDAVEAALMANGGAAFGSRYLISVPAAEGFGAIGSETYGVPADSDLVYNINIHNIRAPPAEGQWHHDDPQHDDL